MSAADHGGIMNEWHDRLNRARAWLTAAAVAVLGLLFLFHYLSSR